MSGFQHDILWIACDKRVKWYPLVFIHSLFKTFSPNATPKLSYVNNRLPCNFNFSIRPWLRLCRCSFIYVYIPNIYLFHQQGTFQTFTLWQKLSELLKRLSTKWEYTMSNKHISLQLNIQRLIIPTP